MEKLGDVLGRVATTWDRDLAEAIGTDDTTPAPPLAELTPAELRERDRRARRAKKRFWKQ